MVPTKSAQLAQLVEHRSYEPKVAGSKPALSIYVFSQRYLNH